MAVTNTIDWDALNAKLKALSASNSSVIDAGSATLPAARTAKTTVTTKQQGQAGSFFSPGTPTTTKTQEVSGTPYEIAKIQAAMKNGTLSGTVNQNGTTKLTNWQGGVGTTLTAGSQTAAGADSLIQALESAGISGASDLVMNAVRGKNGASDLAALTAAFQDYQTQKASSERQAKNYQAGTDLMTDAVTQANANLDAIGAQASTQAGQLSDLWTRTLAKADEFVTNAQNRTKTVLSDIDSMISNMNTNMDFEKAHAMQVGVQSALGQMANEEKAIAKQYGVNSEEMMQFKQTKKQTLASIQSSIQTTYGNLRTSLNQSALTTKAGTSTNMAMYENYNEQSVLEVYKAAAQADAAYKLQTTENLISIENLKLSNQSALADWISNTPVFSTSLSGFVSLAMDLS